MRLSGWLRGLCAQFRTHGGLRRTNHISRRSFSSLGIELLESRIYLSAVSWDGGGGGTHWSDPLNWSSDGLPKSENDVTIGFGTATISHDIGVDKVKCLVTVNPFTLAGGTLSIVTALQVNNMITFDGGNLSGGTVSFAAGQSLAIANNSTNRLTGVAVSGDLTLSAPSANVQIAGGTKFTTAHLSGFRSTLGFAPGSVLSGTVLFEGSDPSFRAVEMNTSGTLTIGPIWVIRTPPDFAGSGQVGSRFVFNGSSTLVNQGTITAQTGGEAQTINIRPVTSFTNLGTLEATNGATLIVSSLIGNLNTLTIAGTSAVTLDGTNYVNNQGLTLCGLSSMRLQHAAETSFQTTSFGWIGLF